MRMTIFHNNIYNAMNKDILEFKIPYDVSIFLANQYLQIYKK